MKSVLIFSILLFLSNCLHSQLVTTENKKQITRNIQKDIEILIPPGEITVDIMDVVTMSSRRKELMSKFMEAYKKNYDWFIEQQKIVDSTGHPIKYDPRVGMTEPEYEEFIKMMKTMSDMEVSSSGTEKVIVSNLNGIISFKTKGRLEYLNSTTIDIKNNKVKVSNYVLDMIDTVNVNNPNNVFKSTWRGYKWQFADPLNAVMPKTKDKLSSFSLKLYNFTLGVLDMTGKTFIELSGSETDRGVKTVTFKLPLLF
jgi:hypothetical protein